MKNLLSLVLVLFIFLQSCNQNELDGLTPKQISSTPIGIENAAKQISEKFALSGAKAILLKPVDNDPNTQLTTLFYADDNGKILPIIENFEIKRVEVISSGVYVLTNYTDGGKPIAFFVDYNLNWVQLNGVGNYISTINGGDVLFDIGSILHTKSLTMKSGVKWVESATPSENLILLSNQQDKFKVVNTATGEEQDLQMDGVYYFADDANIVGDKYISSIISINHDSMAVLEIGTNRPIALGAKIDFKLLNMKTGEITNANLPHKDMDIKPGSVVRNSAGDGVVYTSQLITSKGTFKDIYYTEVVFKGTVVEEVKHHESSYGLIDTTPAYIVALQKLLDIVESDGSTIIDKTKTAYRVIDDLLYYSGKKGGQTVSGIFNLTNNQNTVVTTEFFSSIQPLNK